MSSLRTRWEGIDSATGEVWFVGQSVTPSNPCRRCGKPTKNCRREGYCLVDHERGLGWCGHAKTMGMPPFFRLDEGGVARSVQAPKLDKKRYEQECEIDFEALSRSLRVGFEVHRLAKNLAVSATSLDRLGVGWYNSKGASSWPMSNEIGDVIGIRLRSKDGSKYAVKGSRNGMFLCLDQDWTGTVYVTEGPTDTAAVMGLGLTVVGRASSGTCVEMLVSLLQGSKLVVIVSDIDRDTVQAGQRGAKKLAEALVGVCESVKIIYPLRGKDVREWITKFKATRELIEAVVDNTESERA